MKKRQCDEVISHSKLPLLNWQMAATVIDSTGSRRRRRLRLIFCTLLGDVQCGLLILTPNEKDHNLNGNWLGFFPSALDLQKPWDNCALATNGCAGTGFLIQLATFKR